MNASFFTQLFATRQTKHFKKKIQMYRDIKDVGSDYADWISLAYNRDQSRSFENARTIVFHRRRGM